MSGFQYGGELRSADCYFAKNMTLAQGTSAALKAGVHNGALTVEVNANTDVTLPAGASLTFSLLECDTLDGMYAEPKGSPKVTIAGEATYMAGDKVAKVVLVNCKKFAKVQLEVSGSPTGTIDVWQGYLAR